MDILGMIMLSLFPDSELKGAQSESDLDLKLAFHMALDSSLR